MSEWSWWYRTFGTGYAGVTQNVSWSEDELERIRSRQMRGIGFHPREEYLLRPTGLVESASRVGAAESGSRSRQPQAKAFRRWRRES